MNYRKIFVLLVVTTTAALAFSSAASATTLTSPSGTTYTGAFDASSEGHVTIANPIANISCNSTLEGANKGHGVGITIRIDFSISLTGCTNAWHPTPVLSGSLTIHIKLFPRRITVTLKNLKFDATRLGVTCVYQAGEAEFGALTDSSETGATGTIHVATSIPINAAESSALCGTGSAKWEGSYVINTPDSIFVDE